MLLSLPLPLPLGVCTMYSDCLLNIGTAKTSPTACKWPRHLGSSGRSQSHWFRVCWESAAEDENSQWWEIMNYVCRIWLTWGEHLYLSTLHHSCSYFFYSGIWGNTTITTTILLILRTTNLDSRITFVKGLSFRYYLLRVWKLSHYKLEISS